MQKQQLSEKIAAGKGSRSYADLVLKNGHVYSVNGTSKDAPVTEAEAVAVRDGKIIFVGSDKNARAHIGSKTKIINLEGKMVLPGFVDAHAHAKAMAANLFDISLYGMAGPKEVAAAITEWISTSKERGDALTHITGNGWDTLQEDEMIRYNAELNKAIDSALCDGTRIPVILYDSSHHIVWANTQAMSVAGIAKDTPNPPGGVIVKDQETGELAGIFREDSAINLLLAAIPDNEIWQYKTGIMAFQEMAHSYGITLNQDPQLSDNAIKAYEQLAVEGKLKMRIRGGYLISPVLNDAGDAFAEFDYNTKGVLDKLASKCVKKHTIGDLFRMNFAKIYGDGGGPTTYMKGIAYGGTSGPPSPNVWPQDQLNYLCERLASKDVQIHGHAMGDAALASFLEAFESARNAASDMTVTERRDSVTHLQFVDDGKNVFANGDKSTNDAKKMADLGVIGIPQPFWMVKDSYFTMYWPFCGKARTEACYPMKSLIDEGVIMAGGSDWPVTQPNAPLISIQTGVTRTLPYDHPAIALTQDERRNPMHRTPLGPVERVDVKTMIQSVTINGAYSMYLEDVTGSIEVGKSADMVVLDKNLFEIPAASIGKTNIMITLFKGEIVYTAPQLVVPNQTAALYKSPNPADEPHGITVAGETMSESNIFAVESHETVSDDDHHTKASAITITFDEGIPDLTTADFYVLRERDKVSAATISAEAEKAGKQYTIKVMDLNEFGVPADSLEGDYSLYVYAPATNFTNQGEKFTVNKDGAPDGDSDEKQCQ